MLRIKFYFRIILCGLWFLLASFAALFMTPFRWKNPSLGAVFSRLLHYGTSRILDIHIEVENQSRLYTSQPCIYVINHQSNWDIFTMSNFYPYRTVVIGKKEIAWLPLFGIFFVGSGNILINRSDRQHSLSGLDKAKNEIISKQLSVWIFPEGTRNYGAKKLLPFKKGAFHLAVSAQVPIVPMVHPRLDTYFSPKDYKLGECDLKIKVLEPIPTTGMTTSDIPKLMALTRQKMEAELL